MATSTSSESSRARGPEHLDPASLALPPTQPLDITALNDALLRTAPARD